MFFCYCNYVSKKQQQNCAIRRLLEKNVNSSFLPLMMTTHCKQPRRPSSSKRILSLLTVSMVSTPPAYGDFIFRNLTALASANPLCPTPSEPPRFHPLHSCSHRDCVLISSMYLKFLTWLSLAQVQYLQSLSPDLFRNSRLLFKFLPGSYLRQPTRQDVLVFQV